MSRLTTTPLKPLPSDAHLERNLLGAVLVNPALLMQVRDALGVDDFMYADNRRVYAAMLAAVDAQRMIDELVLREIDPAITFAYLLELTQGVPRLDRVGEWVRSLKGYAIQRRAIEAAAKYGELLYQPGFSAHLPALANRLAELNDQFVVLSGSQLPDPIMSETQYVGEVLNTDAPKCHALPDWRLLNFRLSGGLYPGRVYVVAARPGGGKTSYMLHLCWQLASTGVPGVILELENSDADTRDKLYAAAGKVNAMQLHRHEYAGNADVSDKLYGIANVITNSIGIQCGHYSVDEILALILAYHRQRRIEWYAVDYIQFIRKTDKRVNNLESIGNSMAELMAVSKRHKLTGIVLSQANRAAEGTKISMANMKGSGDIEQGADCIIAIQQSDEDDQFGVCPVEIDLLKNRFGPVGRVKMKFYKQQGRFEEVGQ